MKEVNVGIIGAGLGGCAIAAILSSDTRTKYNVSVFEKNGTIGGRCQSFDMQGFRFDIGASMVLMTDTFKELGDVLGYDFSVESLGLIPCLPVSSAVHFITGESVQISKEQITVINNNGDAKINVDGKRVRKALKEGSIFYNTAKVGALRRSYDSIWDVFDWNIVFAAHDMIRVIFKKERIMTDEKTVTKVRGFTSLVNYMYEILENEIAAKAMSVQSMYMGLSPFDALSFYSFLSCDELANGIYYPGIGDNLSRVLQSDKREEDKAVDTKKQVGITDFNPASDNRSVESNFDNSSAKGKGFSFFPELLMTIAESNGTDLYLNKAVEQIDEMIVGKDRRPILVFESGESRQFDIVISNADLCFTYDKLLRDKSKAKVLDRMGYGCSTVSFHWGIRRDLGNEIPIAHQIFLGESFEVAFNEIFANREAPRSLSFYMHIPSIADPSACIDGNSCVTVLVPVGNEVLSEEQIAGIRAQVLWRIAHHGSGGLFAEKDIVCERIVSPKEWNTMFNLHRGCALGLNHNLFQLGPFRPSNRDKDYPYLFFVGANTQPGCGVPTVLHSAMNAAMLIQGDGQKYSQNMGWFNFQKLFQKCADLGLLSASGRYSSTK